MLEMDEDTLIAIAMALREHAQTCDDIAFKYSNNRETWNRQAERCRNLARRYEAAAKVKRISKETSSTPDHPNGS